MKFRGVLLCGAGACVVWVQPAFAQNTGGPEAEAGQQNAVIIVNARRRDEDVQDVPAVVDTVTADEVAKLNLQQFEEVEGLVPGLDLKSEANGIAASGQLRGVSYNPNGSPNPTVEFYLNDAPVQATVVLQQIYDVGQIEVLRGPQGTLRGRASPSGSITVTTRKPDLYDIGGYASMSGSDIGTININGAVGLPIIEGVAAIRVAGIYSEGEGNRVRTIDNSLDGRDPFIRNKGARVSALLQPTDWLKLEAVYQRIDNNARVYDQYASFSLVDPGTAATNPLIRPSDRLSIAETPRDISQVFDIYNGRAEVRAMGQVLIYQFQQTNIKLQSVSNSDAANAFDGYDFFQITNTKAKNNSHEIRLQNENRVFGIFDYVVGFFDQSLYAPTNLTQDTPIALPAFLGGGVVATVQTPIATVGVSDETSFFGNITAHITDQTDISAGLRHIDLQTPQRVLLIGGNQLPGGAPINDEAFIYSASIKHNFTPDLMVYASTGTSRRAPTTIVGNFSPVQSDLQRFFTFLPPEKSESYELGMKSTWLDGRMRLNLTGYYQKFDNYPYILSTPVNYLSFTFVPGTGLVPTAASGAQFAAPVPVEIKGVEAELGFDLDRSLSFNIVAAYADGKIKNGLIPCNDLNGDGIPDGTSVPPTVAQLQAAYGADFIGSCNVTQRSTNTPPFSFTAQAEYAVPLSGEVDLFARGLFSFFGNSQTDPANPFDDVGDYGLLNLFGGIRDPEGAWEVQLFAKNVLNTTRTTSFNTPATSSFQTLQPPTFQTTASSTATSGYSIIATTAPQEFGINVRFAFGSR